MKLVFPSLPSKLPLSVTSLHSSPNFAQCCLFTSLLYLTGADREGGRRQREGRVKLRRNNILSRQGKNQSLVTKTKLSCNLNTQSRTKLLLSSFVRTTTGLTVTDFDPLFSLQPQIILYNTLTYIPCTSTSSTVIFGIRHSHYFISRSGSNLNKKCIYQDISWSYSPWIIDMTSTPLSNESKHHEYHYNRMLLLSILLSNQMRVLIP